MFTKHICTCVITGFHRFNSQTVFRSCVNENAALLGYCAVLIGIYLPTFRDSLLVPSSTAKQPGGIFRPLHS
jgi:hypothetical protein